MTREEALRIVKKSSGRLCVRYVQHPKTKAPVFADKLYQITRQTGFAAGVLGATLAASSLTYAQGNTFEPKTITELPTTLSRTNSTNKDENKDTPTGSISGTVTNQAGAAIPGATITATFKDLRRTVTSNDSGSYTIYNLPSGTYELTINSPGFMENKVSQVELTEKFYSQTINTILEVGEIFISGGIGIAIIIENPLINSVYDEKIREVRSLIARGSDVNAKDEGYYSRTALHVAVNENNLEILRILLNAGADVNALDEEGNTPLMLLDEQTSEEIVKLLVRYGTKLDIQSKEDKRTALLNAAMEDNYKAMKILIEAGANVNLRDSDGDSALGLASDEKIEQLLIAYGAEQDKDQ